MHCDKRYWCSLLSFTRPFSTTRWWLRRRLQYMSRTTGRHSLCLAYGIFTQAEVNMSIKPFVICLHGLGAHWARLRDGIAITTDIGRWAVLLRWLRGRDQLRGELCIIIAVFRTGFAFNSRRDWVNTSCRASPRVRRIRCDALTQPTLGRLRHFIGLQIFIISGHRFFITVLRQAWAGFADVELTFLARRTCWRFEIREGGKKLFLREVVICWIFLLRNEEFLVLEFDGWWLLVLAKLWVIGVIYIYITIMQLQQEVSLNAFFTCTSKSLLQALKYHCTVFDYDNFLDCSSSFFAAGISWNVFFFFSKKKRGNNHHIRLGT